MEKKKRGAGMGEGTWRGLKWQMIGKGQRGKERVRLGHMQPQE